MKLSNLSQMTASEIVAGAASVVNSTSAQSESILLSSPSSGSISVVTGLITLNLYAVAGFSPPKDMIPALSNLPSLQSLFTRVVPSRSSKRYVPSFAGSSVIAHCIETVLSVTFTAFGLGASI